MAAALLENPAIRRHIANLYISQRRVAWQEPFTEADLVNVHPSSLKRMYVNDELSVEEFEQAIDALLRLGAW